MKDLFNVPVVLGTLVLSLISADMAIATVHAAPAPLVGTGAIALTALGIAGLFRLASDLKRKAQVD